MAPKDDRQRQVETTKAKYGADYYKRIGKSGGLNSPTRFNSDSARQAVKKRWETIKKDKEKSDDI